jgi:hypothetical protein
MLKKQNGDFGVSLDERSVQGSHVIATNRIDILRTSTNQALYEVPTAAEYCVV